MDGDAGFIHFNVDSLLQAFAQNALGDAFRQTGRHRCDANRRLRRHGRYFRYDVIRDMDRTRL
ncbi:hypothetical protein D1872_332950 [compost metagenome]